MSETILIAVPDLIFRAKITETARQVGQVAVSAATPEKVMARALEHRPALVVVDLGDDRIDPFETIRRLKATPETAGSRIVGFFAHVHTEQRDSAIAAGCDRVLPRSSFVAKLAGLLESLGAETA